MKYSILLFILSPLLVIAQDFTSKYTLSESNSGKYGDVLSMDGDYLLVGAPNNGYDANGNNYKSSAGAAYLYEKNENNEYVLIQKLLPFLRTAGSLFGTSVDVFGDKIIIGENWPENPGAAYVFERNSNGTFDQVAKLTESAVGEWEYYGTEVAINDNYAAVSAKYHPNSTDDGIVFIYQKVSGVWQKVKELKSSDLEQYDNFGTAIDFSEDLLAVTAEKNGEGALYIYSIDSAFNHEIKLTPPYEHDDMAFGRQMRIHNNQIAVTASGFHYNASYTFPVWWAGAVFVYELSDGTWGHSGTLVASDRTESAYFGHSLGLSDNLISVSDFIGHSYIYEKQDGQWKHIQKLTNPNSSYDFGSGVVNNDETVFIGGTKSTHSGIVYLYDTTTIDTTQNDTTVSDTADTTNASIYTLYKKDFEVYPNPTKDIIVINGNFNAAKLFNVYGREVLNSTEKRFDVGILPSGIYIIQLLDEKNQIIGIKKVQKL